MIDIVKKIRIPVKLDVLRPPTFDALQKLLNSRKGYYHLVHFDGHGAFQQSSGHLSMYGVRGTEGTLFFETEDEKPHEVTASDLGQQLANCRVPIFVMNACQSAEEGGLNPFSSIASQMISIGATAVVAMGYSVMVRAASLFIERFYERLVEGCTIEEAVAAGRLRLMNERNRPTPKGDLPLSDWIVPVLYQQHPCFVPFSKTEMTQPEMVEIDHGRISSQIPVLDLPPVGKYGFIGRDYEILRLERAFRKQRIVVLTGMAGVGKTALACDFARWLADTGDRKGGIYFTKFEHGGNVEQILQQTGRTLKGPSFSLLPQKDQHNSVVRYLNERPCLLIWDNFETVYGFPDGTEPLLSESERKSLNGFLEEIRNGSSLVLVTSRRDEKNLPYYKKELLVGLNEGDAIELAKVILSTVSVDLKKLGADFLDLLRLLKGHPLAMRVVLPHLEKSTPKDLITALRKGLDELEDMGEEGRELSLTVSLDYSFSRMTAKAQKHLPLLGLFAEWIAVHDLSILSKSETCSSTFGETMQESNWRQVLEEAHHAGILMQSQTNKDVFEIHPAIPWFLRRKLNQRFTEEQIKRLEEEFVELYAKLGDALIQAISRSPQAGVAAISAEEANLLHAIQLAELGEKWGEVQSILQPIIELYEIRGRVQEARSLRNRLLRLIGSEFTETPESDAASLRMYLLGLEANEALDVHKLERAEQIYKKILQFLQSAKTSDSVENKIAAAFHQLGRVAEEERKFDEAKRWYNKALEIKERFGDELNAAGDYHQLGRVAQEERKFDEAKRWYNKALEIHERLSYLGGKAADFGQLGRLAEAQSQFGEAEQLYMKALALFEEIADPAYVEVAKKDAQRVQRLQIK
jgi:tetratricopeptide (TPR) repeat protein